MLFLLTLVLVLLLLLLPPSGDEIHVLYFPLPCEGVRGEVFIVGGGLAALRGDAVQDDIDHMVVGYLSIEIESFNIIQVFCTIPVCLRLLISIKVRSSLYWPP